MMKVMLHKMGQIEFDDILIVNQHARHPMDRAFISQSTGNFTKYFFRSQQNKIFNIQEGIIIHRVINIFMHSNLY